MHQSPMGKVKQNWKYGEELREWHKVSIPNGKGKVENLVLDFIIYTIHRFVNSKAHKKSADRMDILPTEYIDHYAL